MTALPAIAPGFASRFETGLSPKDRQGQEFIWQMKAVRSYDELILSWNGERPKKGKWSFWASVFLEGWSPWIRYAEWGPRLQKTFKYAPQGSRVETYQDAVYSKEGLANAFRVKAVAEEGADLKRLETLFVCLSELERHTTALPQETLQSVLIKNYPLRSQLKLDHPRHLDLCSPTATANAIQYLLGAKRSDPVAFAEKVRDQEFDIYGNWILNTAEAYSELGGKYRVWVERLPSFAALHSRLMRGLPVIVSLRGPLAGTYKPMTFGHLLTVIGFDAKEQKVHCVDSAFPEDGQTAVSYPLQGFLEAWARRQNIAYLFEPKNLESSLKRLMPTYR